MAVRSLTPLGHILKWLLVPGALAVAGYYLLGPRMDRLMPGAQPGVNLPAATAPEVKVKEPPVPEVEVTAKPSGRGRPVSFGDEPPRERPRKRRERQNPVPIQPVAEKRPDQKKNNPAAITGEGVSSEDPNAIDPVQKPPEKEPPKENPDPASTGGGTGEAGGATPPTPTL
jgi:hypothetical protein